MRSQELQAGLQLDITESSDRGFSEWGGFEPFVDEDVVAEFLDIEPRRVLEMARKGEIPAHPIGGQRKTWRFRLSEIDAHFSHQNQKQTPANQTQAPASIRLAVPVTPQRRNRG
jgi:Helix-turn-helix domain